MNADEELTHYAEVLLPLHLPQAYTYRLPRELEGRVAVGCRVVVQFGRTRLYSALVRRIHTNQPPWRTKYVIDVLDSEPVVTERQMQFWEWMARYYMCYTGDVMAMALPAAMKLQSESAVSINPEWDGELSALGRYETQIVQLLASHPVMKVADLGRAIGVQKVMPLLRGMLERGIVSLDEELRERFRPRRSAFLLLPEAYRDEARLKEAMDNLERRRRTKQLDVLLRFLQASRFGAEAVAKRQMPQGSPLEALIRDGLLAVEEREVNRPGEGGATAEADAIVLNSGQQEAYRVMSALRQPPAAPSVGLLHGVTSSGKTEVYIKLIADVVRQGKQALLLLPEIALTTQVVERLRRYFGPLVGVYHSRFGASQRAEVWRRTLSTGQGRYQVLLGARSALFLPYSDLGLVIVDEEHDPSYKQQDPAPRYQARDAAIKLASLWGARTVLGSATPSVESYHHAREGKYALATLTQRYGGFELPEVITVDLKQERQAGRLHGHFSSTLIDHLRATLARGQQAILFQNRRGFAQRIECDDCHDTPQCVHCDVSLVYHKATSTLRCHYCGYSIPVPSECPKCHSTHLRMVGIGTERIEEDLQIMLPEARIARMDLDTTLQKNQYAELIEDFRQRKIDILVGTQMVTKGLDFDNVSLVGIISADGLINYPNFRSFERAFQQMTQVSGRAGRHGTGGSVIIQTYNPLHQVIQDVVHLDYAHLFAEQIQERRVFRYPPFYRLIEVTLKHRDAAVLDAAADWLAAALRGAFGTRVMGPEYPMVSRVRALYLKVVTLRFAQGEPVAEAKRLAMRMADDLVKREGWSSVAVHFDVDPY